MFVIRRLQELARKKRFSLYVCFIDLTKTYDSVDRTLLCTVRARFGGPQNMISVIRRFHDGMRAARRQGVSVATIGGGGDTTIPSPGRSPKQPLPGIGLHDPLYIRQACPEFTSSHQGVGQISPREETVLCRPLPKRGKICDIPTPPPNR